MKLDYRYYLIDKDNEKVLEISSDFGSRHMAQMRDVYGVIYPDRIPLRIIAVDILGESREVDTDIAV